MRITSTVSFVAPPERVADMLVNPRFAEFVARKADAQNLTVTGIDSGLTAVLTTVAPEKASVLLGVHMTITWTITWNAPAEDGSRAGRVTVNLSGIPASLTGPVRLYPTETGSTLILDADFTVAVPLLGRKAEKMASGYMSRLVSTCEALGQEWLDANP